MFLLPLEMKWNTCILLQGQESQSRYSKSITVKRGGGQFISYVCTLIHKSAHEEGPLVSHIKVHRSLEFMPLDGSFMAALWVWSGDDSAQHVQLIMTNLTEIHKTTKSRRVMYKYIQRGKRQRKHTSARQDPSGKYECCHPNPTSRHAPRMPVP